MATFAKDFLSIDDISPLQIRALIECARQLKAERLSGYFPERLKHKSIVLLFDKSSTRTRCAFEVAAAEEGAHVTVLTNSHFGKKESIADTAQVLSRYYHGIQHRGNDLDDVYALAKSASVPVWNGLTDQNHPTQAIADVMTISEQVDKPYQAIKVVFVGDALCNTATSLMRACSKLGMHFYAYAPTSRHPDVAQQQSLAKTAQSHGGSIVFTDDKALAMIDADIVYTDVWFSMGEEDEMAARIKLLQPYQVNTALMTATENPRAKFMHCLPAFHDTQTQIGQTVAQQLGYDSLEVTDAVFQGPQSIVFDQAENRLHTIKAIMLATLQITV